MRHDERAAIALALPGWVVRYRGDTREYEATRSLPTGGRVTYADRDGERLVATVVAADDVRRAIVRAAMVGGAP